jgi:O-antigen/teichoic acid export membrane protein
MPSLSKNITLSFFTFFNRIISGSIVYIVLARVMSIEEFGILSFGVTFAGLLTVIAEFGFSLMAQRDIPQKRYGFNEYVYSAVFQKLGFSFLAALGGVLYLTLSYSGFSVKVGLVFLINAIVTSNNMYLFAVFRSINKYKFESLVSGIYSILLIGIISVYYIYSLDILFLSFGLLLSRFVQFIVLFYILIIKYGYPTKVFDKEIQKYLFKNSFSFGAHYIIGVFYFTIDSQLIYYYAGASQLAIYQSIFRIVLILLSFGDLINNVIIPFLASKFSFNKDNFIQIARVLNKTIITIGLALSIAFILFVEQVLNLLYSNKYDDALSIIFPLCIVLFIRISTSIYAALLTVSDHQNVRVIIVFVSLLINVILNIALIPIYGFIGASYVSMITHIVMFIMYILFSKIYLNSTMFDFEMLVLSTITVSFFLIYRFFYVEFNLFYSFISIFVWLFVVLFVYKKDFFLNLKELYNNSY